MELSKLTGQQISLKLKSQDAAMNCTVKSVIESRGIWVTGAPVLQHVVQKGGGGPPMKNPMTFVLFESVEWIVAESH